MKINAPIARKDSMMERYLNQLHENPITLQNRDGAMISVPYDNYKAYVNKKP